MTAKMISNAIYGVGLIAKASGLEGRIDFFMFTDFFKFTRWEST